MKAQTNIQVKLSENQANGGEYGDLYWPEMTSEHERGDSRIFVVPATTTDFEIDLTNLIATGTILALRADKNIDVRLNLVTNAQIPLEIVAEDRYAYFYATGDITKLFISTGSEETQVVIGFVGDA